MRCLLLDQVEFLVAVVPSRPRCLSRTLEGATPDDRLNTKQSDLDWHVGHVIIIPHSPQLFERAAARQAVSNETFLPVGTRAAFLPATQRRAATEGGEANLRYQRSTPGPMTSAVAGAVATP